VRRDYPARRDNDTARRRWLRQMRRLPLWMKRAAFLRDFRQKHGRNAVVTRISVSP
jgi:hypothetical protein